MEGQGRVLGIPASFEHDGRTFQIPPWNFEIEGLFAAWVADRAERRIKSKRRADGDEEYREEMASLRRDISKGLYEWGSEVVIAAMQSASGSRQLAYLTLSRLDKSITPEWVDALSRNRRAWDDLWSKLLELNFPPEPAPEGRQETPPEAGTPTA